MFAAWPRSICSAHVCRPTHLSSSALQILARFSIFSLRWTTRPFSAGPCERDWLAGLAYLLFRYTPSASSGGSAAASWEGGREPRPLYFFVFSSSFFPLFFSLVPCAASLGSSLTGARESSQISSFGNRRLRSNKRLWSSIHRFTVDARKSTMWSSTLAWGKPRASSSFSRS